MLQTRASGDALGQNIQPAYNFILYPFHLIYNRRKSCLVCLIHQNFNHFQSSSKSSTLQKSFCVLISNHPPRWKLRTKCPNVILRVGNVGAKMKRRKTGVFNVILKKYACHIYQIDTKWFSTFLILCQTLFYHSCFFQ